MNILTVLTTALSVGGGIFITASYIPQIRQLHKTKKADDLSTSFWVILILGLLCTTTNMVLNNSPLSVLAPQFINVVLAATVLVQVLVYKRR